MDTFLSVGILCLECKCLTEKGSGRTAVLIIAGLMFSHTREYRKHNMNITLLYHCQGHLRYQKETHLSTVLFVVKGLKAWLRVSDNLLYLSSIFCPTQL